MSSTSSSLHSFEQSLRSSSDEYIATGRGRGRGGRGRGRRGRGLRGRGGLDALAGQATGVGGNDSQTRDISAERTGAVAQRASVRAGSSRRSRYRRLFTGDDERVEELRRQRIEESERLLQSLTLGDHRRLTSQLLQRQPGLVFDTLALQRHCTPVEVPGLPWCTCGNCIDMPTDAERKCCGQDPVNCISSMAHFRQYCLDEGVLRIHRQYRADITVLGQISEPGDDNREYRYAAYRHFIFWQHGALGQGNRRVIPSCCVAKIRNQFPDPQGQYRGYVAGI